MTDLPDHVAGWLTHLEERIAQGGWDQQFTLWVISIEPSDKNREGSGADVYAFMQVPIPELVGSGVAPSVYLKVLADGLRTNPKMRASALKIAAAGAPFAVAFACESWTIPTRDMAVWSNRSWSTHPNRTEVRTITAADAHGNRYIISREKDTDKVRIAHNRMKELKAVNGSITEAITQVLNALRIPLAF